MWRGCFLRLVSSLLSFIPDMQDEYILFEGFKMLPGLYEVAISLFRLSFLHAEFLIRLREINKTPLDFYWSFSLHTPSQGLFFKLWIIIIYCISFNNMNQRVISFVIDAKYLYNFSRVLNHIRLIYIFNYTHSCKKIEYSSEITSP